MNGEILRPAKNKPVYAVTMQCKNGYILNLDSVVVKLMLSEPQNEIAQRCIVRLANTEVDGHLLSEMIAPLNMVFISANDGDRDEEVFRGFVWTDTYTNNSEKTIQITAYDNLIYLMSSEDSRYYPTGSSSEWIITDICSAWGIDLIYTYDSITHKKLPMSGTIADMILSVLEKVRLNTRKKYVVRSAVNVMYIKNVGENAMIYDIVRGYNAIQTSSTTTLKGTITSVGVLGERNDDGYTPIDATYDGDTETWGTLRKLINSSTYDDSNEKKSETDRTFESAEAEAQSILDEHGQPKVTFNVEGTDIPWIRKGDNVRVVAGDMSALYTVLSIWHDGVEKTMGMEVELYEERAA